MGITSIILLTIGNYAFAIEYTNEKCGVSIRLPEDWEVENDDFKGEVSRSFVIFSPDPDDVLTQISINIWDIADYGEKTIEYVSEIFRPSEDDTESGVIQDDILEVGGFPAQKLTILRVCQTNMNFKKIKCILWK